MRKISRRTLVAVLLISCAARAAWPERAIAASFCVWNALSKSLPVEKSFGIVMRNGRVVSKNGDPVIAAFDLDETFVRRILTTGEARALRRAPGHQVVSINVHGTVTHYEVLPGMLSALKELERRGIRVVFFSAGDAPRNQALLKAIRVPETGEPLLKHVGGRLLSPSEIRYNLDPLSTRADILKPLKPLAHEAAGGDIRKFHADLHNAFIVDDAKGTSIHQIWIPSPGAGGPPFDWPHRGAYITGVFRKAVALALREPGLSLGEALKRVQTVNLLDRAQWSDNVLIRVGRLRRVR